MARSSVQGGGNYTDWLQYAEDEPLVMFRLIRQLDDKLFDNGPAKCALVDAVILDGPDADKIILDDEVVGKGMTNELLRLDDGDDLPCRIVVKKRGSTEYPAIAKIDKADEKIVDRTFPPGDEDGVWDELRAKAKAKKSKRRDDDEDRDDDRRSSRRGRDDDRDRDERRSRRDDDRRDEDERRSRDRDDDRRPVQQERSRRDRDDEDDDRRSRPRRSRSRDDDEDDRDDRRSSRRDRDDDEPERDRDDDRGRRRPAPWGKGRR